MFSSKILFQEGFEILASFSNSRFSKDSVNPNLSAVDLPDEVQVKLKVLKKTVGKLRCRQVRVLSSDWVEILGDFFCTMNIYISFKRHRIHNNQVIIFAKCTNTSCATEYRIVGEIAEDKVTKLKISSDGNCNHKTVMRPLKGKAREKMGNDLLLRSTSEYFYKAKSAGLTTHNHQILRKAKSEISNAQRKADDPLEDLRKELESYQDPFLAHLTTGPKPLVEVHLHGKLGYTFCQYLKREQTLILHIDATGSIVKGESKLFYYAGGLM